MVNIDSASGTDRELPTIALNPKMQQSRLDFSRKTAQETVHRRLIELASTGAVTPLVAELDLTTYCDYECPECISSSLLSAVHLADSEIDRIIDTLFELQVKAVILTGGGEPLRHHAAGTVIDRLTCEGIKVGLVTNGLLVDRLSPRSLKKLDWIRISLDAANSTTYVKFCPHRLGAAAFAKVLNNIEHASNFATSVGVSYVVLTRHEGESQDIDNIDEIEECARISKERGAKYLNVKAMELPNHHLFRYSAKEIHRIVDALTESESKFVDDKFDIVLSSNLREIIKGNGLVRQDKSYTRCLSSALRVTITSKRVFPCSYHRGNRNLNCNPRREFESFDKTISYPRMVEADPAIDCPFFCARHDANLALEAQLEMLASNQAFVPERDWDLFL